MGKYDHVFNGNPDDGGLINMAMHIANELAEVNRLKRVEIKKQYADTLFINKTEFVSPAEIENLLEDQA